MNRLITIALLLPLINLWGGELSHGPDKSQGIVGAAIVLKTDFDIYKIRHGDKRPYIYSYMIMPAPEISIGGRFYTYLGRMPAGTILEVTSFESSKGAKKGEYRVKAISPINDRIKANTPRKAHKVEENLEEQNFKLRGMEVRIGVSSIYSEGRYPDDTPKLNETWFEIIDIKNLKNRKVIPTHTTESMGSVATSASEIREELPIGTTFTTTTDFWIYKIKGRFLRKGLPYINDNNYTMSPDTKMGIGGLYLSYTSTLPAGTRLEVISLVKKNKQKWFYIAKTIEYTNPQIGEATIAIYPTAMLRITWGKQPFGNEPLNIKTTELDPDLFTNFVYPDE